MKKETNRINDFWARAVIVVLLTGALMMSGCIGEESGGDGDINATDQSNITQPENKTVTPSIPKTTVEIKTFEKKGDSVCTKDGKPIIRLFSTTLCSHCTWIKGTYDKVALEYVSEGKIVAYHWELNTKDDTLTSEVEGSVPESETSIYREFNPGGTIPTFVFGCKYYRIGTGYEREGNLSKEEGEFRAVIEKLIEESG